MDITPAARCIAQFVTEKLRTRERFPYIVGICGAQGSGKSTACDQLISILSERGLRAATLALDDIYLSAADRAALAGKVHPLLKTRGVPGTHEVQLGIDLLQQARQQQAFLVPRFDKARDDRAPQEIWTQIDTPLDVLFFEGWCVGARPQQLEELIEPVNDLERSDDPNRVWRTYVNERLASEYQILFGYLDALVLIAAPNFEVVAEWRKEQEHALRDRLLSQGLDASGAMSDAQIDRFVQHYERLTRHILKEMPSRADLTLRLDAARAVQLV
ncbi:MAG TPA: hypothetical protein VFS47_05860 [Steroidobacteraceae bacterium]|nr:hypothetical protein [Steroidobacteraceae bacterium]